MGNTATGIEIKDKNTMHVKAKKRRPFFRDFQESLRMATACAIAQG